MKTSDFIPDKYRVCVVSAANGNAEWQAQLTNPNKDAYCRRHGYDFKYARLEGGDPHFAKYGLVEKEILTGAYDYVVWMDTDAWFNADVPFSRVIDRYSEKDTALIIARDHGMLGCDRRLFDCYLNTGVMVFKSDGNGLEVIRRYGNLHEDQTARRMVESLTEWRDQPYMCLLAIVDEFVRSKTAIASPYALNAFAQLGFSEDTFICHLPSVWAKKYLEDRVKRSAAPPVPELGLNA